MAIKKAKQDKRKMSLGEKINYWYKELFRKIKQEK